ncbi:DUF6678 family protein [Duganella radicis]|uniref:Uncharacterized protein n=1 Tax=Duganella radicis TaxID=551988 RepID=A0A6L6PCD8_9BURK|nr:DUF6678 family protein [Duganella radicis]MTV36704.1 hypothetical protein [Duganella radicis]
MQPLMNDTKWDELRLAMYGLGPLSPRWRTLDVQNGHLSDWDGDWFYHFRNGGYKFIQWVEIATESAGQRHAVLAELTKVHVPGKFTEAGFRVLGYAELGVAIDYLTADV